ncbi:MAG: GAF domain-containing protein [Bacteroidales bacterium]|nr:GAF domain-containing protein [Bacteroidales bacterium]
MKKFKLSIKSKFRLFLLITLLPFVIVSVIFVVLLGRNKAYEDYEQKVLTIKLEYLKLKEYEQSFLLYYTTDNTFFKTNENEYLRKFELEQKQINKNFDELLNLPATATLDLNNNIYMLKENATSYGDLLKLVASKFYKRGSYTTGIIGEIERSYATAVSQKSLPAPILSSLKEMEVQYLNRKDAAYYNDFINIYTLNMGSAAIVEPEPVPIVVASRDSSQSDSASVAPIAVQQPQPKAKNKNSEKLKPVNDFKRFFTSLVKIDKEIGFNREEGLLFDLQVEKSKLDDIDSILTKISEQKEQTASTTRLLLIIIAILIILALAIAIAKFSNKITSAISKISGYVNALSKGIIPDEEIKCNTNDELADMAVELNTFAHGLKETTQFASSIGSGNLDTEFKPLSENDLLGNSLLEMRSNLYKSQQEDEKRQREDSLRKWANEGLTQFSEILRQSTSNINDLANNVLKNLIHFLDANQGGLFLYNDNNKNDVYLELVSSYAYNQERKKKKKIYLGEGLIGTCAIEKSYVYLTDLPNDYLSITSGLGGANPNCLLIMPLKVEEQIFGVMEIASFKKMEKHEIDFVEKVSESIASTLSIAKINQRTAELLAQSQQQAEEMASQEEEMRQNLEELQATQEESARKEAEMQSILNAVNSSSLVIEYDLTGNITSVNEAFCKAMNLQREQTIGRTLDEYRDSTEENSLQDADFWSRVRDGEVVKRTDKYVTGGEEHWLHQVFTPIIDSDGFPYKILNMATDITASKKQEIELKVQADKMAAQEEVMRHNLEELQHAQQAMAAQQEELNEANQKLHDNESNLISAIEKSKAQEKELQEKVEELNKLHKELEIQQAEILEQNRELQEREKVQTKALQNADRNLERTRMKIMAEFVHNLERHVAVMEEAEQILRRNKNNVPAEVINTISDLKNQFMILITKYKFE